MRVARRIVPNPGARRGAAAVEVAITLPMILALMLGLWEFGRLAEAQQIISAAAREGGRQASTGQKTAAQVQADVLTYLQRAGLVQTSQGTSPGQALAGVTVAVTQQPGNSAVDPSQMPQLGHFRVSVTVPADQLRWVVLDPTAYSNYLGGPKLASLSASADWYSMADLPVSVPLTIPPQ